MEKNKYYYLNKYYSINNESLLVFCMLGKLKWNKWYEYNSDELNEYFRKDTVNQRQVVK